MFVQRFGASLGGGSRRRADDLRAWSVEHRRDGHPATGGARHALPVRLPPHSPRVRSGRLGRTAAPTDADSIYGYLPLTTGDITVPKSRVHWDGD
jgi:hypothetical protein